MHLQAVVSTSNAGAGVCKACGQHSNKRISLKVALGDEPAFGFGAKICPSCMMSPGIVMSHNFKIPHPLEVADLKAKKSRSKRGELKTARETGGRLTKASGATFGDGDVTNSVWFIEEKNWSVKTLGRLNKDVLRKVMAQAARVQKPWVLRLRLIGYDLAVMLWSDALEFIREATD